MRAGHEPRNQNAALKRRTELLLDELYQAAQRHGIHFAIKLSAVDVRRSAPATAGPHSLRWQKKT
jgi:hypothetical protein